MRPNLKIDNTIGSCLMALMTGWYANASAATLDFGNFLNPIVTSSVDVGISTTLTSDSRSLSMIFTGAQVSIGNGGEPGKQITGVTITVRIPIHAIRPARLILHLRGTIDTDGGSDCSIATDDPAISTKGPDAGSRTLVGRYALPSGDTTKDIQVVVSCRPPANHSVATVTLDSLDALLIRDYGSCQPANEDLEISLRGQLTVLVPADGTSGHFVVESHYATQADSFRNNAQFPTSEGQDIDAHLARSCALLTKSRLSPVEDCMDVYPPKQKWTRVWSPAEGGGTFGQTSRGSSRPPPSEELWQANMNFQSIPPIGTHMLIRNRDNKRAVVVAMGREVGPSATKFLGGAVREVHWYLKSNDETSLELRTLEEQSLAYGPINCDFD